MIGIAVGTVLLPEMTRRIAADDHAGARAAQNRAIEFALLLGIPCIVAFLVVPEAIMRGLFMRGRFTADDAHAAAMTLMAYTIGLVPFVLIRSVVAPFLARGDTFTPMKAALIGTGINIAFKVALMGSLAQVGLALATSIGAWINFALVLYWAARANYVGADVELRSSLIRLCGAGLAMALLLFLAAPPISQGGRRVAALSQRGRALAARGVGGACLWRARGRAVRTAPALLGSPARRGEDRRAARRGVIAMAEPKRASKLLIYELAPLSLLRLPRAGAMEQSE